MQFNVIGIAIIFRVFVACANVELTGEINSVVLSAISGGITDGTSLSGTSIDALMNTLDHRNVV